MRVNSIEFIATFHAIIAFLMLNFMCASQSSHIKMCVCVQSVQKKKICGES